MSKRKKRSDQNRKSKRQRSKHNSKKREPRRAPKFSSLEDVVLEFFKNNEGAKIPVTIVEQVIEIEQQITSNKIKKAVQHLVQLGALNKNKAGLLSLKDKSFSLETDEISSSKPTYEGKLSFNKYGAGFITCSEFPEDIKVMKRDVGLALPGDIVIFELLYSRGHSRQHGKVIQIKERSTKLLVGTLLSESSNTYYILPDNQSNPYEFYVKEEDINGAQINDKVSFSIDSWTHPRALPRAKVIDILGQKGSHEAEMRSIMVDNEISSSFPEQVEHYVEEISNEIPQDEINRRLDLRDKTIFTIDPVDAKDFDDALSIEKLDNGNHLLGVHIADVTHFLTEDSVLDIEAKERATSTYLVDRVIPMLPEKLSNGLCSLNPHEDTLTFSCFMEISEEGEVIDYSIRETIIHSKYRFAYEDAQAVLDGADHPLKSELDTLWNIAEIQLKKRFKKGAINFDTPEPRFVLDAKKVPISVKVKERLNAHRLIEECMLLANKMVSIHIENLREKHTGRKTKKIYPFLYRVHDKPDPKKLMNLSELLGPLGIEFPVSDRGVRHSTLNKLIDQVKDTPLEHIVNSLLLRSMAKAVYSPRNIGHFGLNFSHYTHFTSPIRRYPDVIVHRLLKKYAQNETGYQYEDLEEMGEHCSQREKDAQNAERDSVKFKQAEFLSKRIGEEYDGVINGVTENGLYVLLHDNYCEGMVTMNELDDDFYHYDSRLHELYGKRRGKTFRLGDQVTIKVKSVDLKQKTIDFTIVQD